MGPLDATEEERTRLLIGERQASAHESDELLDDLVSDCLHDPTRYRSRLLEIGGMELEDTHWYSLDDLRREVVGRLSWPATLVVRHREPKYHLPRPRESEAAASARSAAVETAEPDVAITRIEAPWFIPGLEDIAIEYEISGPLAKVRTLYLTIASQAAPDEVIFEAEIPAASSQAKGTYRWDGTVRLAAGVATLKSSPYEVQLTLTSASGQRHESNRVRVAVEVHSVEIEVADPEQAGVPQRHRKPLADLRAELLANKSPSGADGRLIVTSPRFKYNFAEMYLDWSFKSYRQQRGNDEILVPLVLNVWLRAKEGDRKRSAKVTEGTRVLWRVQLRDGAEFDDVMTGRQVRPSASRFMKAANAHAHAACRPAGWAAHRAAGGMKAAPGEPGGNEPSQHRLRAMDWPHHESRNRPWDLFTQCGDYSFTLTGDSGAWFWGGHVAGDAHRISAILDQHETLDVGDEPPLDDVPGALRSNPITIENWRHIPVVRQLTLGRSGVDWMTVQQELNKAAMLVAPRPSSRAEDFTELWAHYYSQAVDDLRRRKKRLGEAILENPAPYPVRFRDFEDYWGRLKQGLGWASRAFMRSTEEEAYKGMCDAWAVDICERVANKMAAEIVNDGLTVVTFDTDRIHNQESGARIVGLAPDISKADRAVVFLFNAGGVGAGETAIHEIGHALFLAHAPGSFDPDEPPAGVDTTEHDADQPCLMSYDPRATGLCGFCLLKLAGWDPKKINANGTLRVP